MSMTLAEDETLRRLAQAVVDAYDERHPYMPTTDLAVNALRSHLVSPSPARALAASPTPPAPDGLADAVRPLTVEDLAQHIHDNRPDCDWTWPEHEDDTGKREGGYVRLTPTDVRLECRDQAMSIWRFLRLDAALSDQPTPPVGVDRRARLETAMTLGGVQAVVDAYDGLPEATRHSLKEVLGGHVDALRARLSSTPTPDADRVDALRVAARELDAIERQVKITCEMDRNETAAKKADPVATTVEISLSHVLDSVKRLRATLDGASRVEGA